jgi:hypothetical protein
MPNSTTTRDDFAFNTSNNLLFPAIFGIRSAEMAFQKTYKISQIANWILIRWIYTSTIFTPRQSVGYRQAQDHEETDRLTGSRAISTFYPEGD